MALLLFTTGAVGCARLEPIEVPESKSAKAVPVIRRSFASKQISPGDTWKVYLIASDPEGEMDKIVCTIDQPGVGEYPVSFTKIKEENRKELAGYIYLNTQTSDDLNSVNITLTVQILDRVGHSSSPAVFPLSFDSRFQQEPPPPGVFPKQDLGPILIQLRPVERESPGIFFRRRFP
jgi:hypothetical protein